MAVPKSGWTKTRKIGPAAKPIAVSTVLLSPIRFARSASMPARKSTRSSFPNSEGWNLKKPRSSQRFEPRVTAPASRTITISPSVPT